MNVLAPAFLSVLIDKAAGNWHTRDNIENLRIFQPAEEHRHLILSTDTPLWHIARRLKLFLALSRTPHGLIDMASPALAALLYLGHFPAWPVTLVGLITVFAGYTAVYALNDLVDIATDRERVRMDSFSEAEKQSDLDGLLARHPLAKGALSVREALAWTGAWALIAMTGAFWLNPFCLVLFVGGCLLEAIYCKLWRVTPLRTLLNGMVKTIGSLAAVYAVDPSPAPGFVAALFFWLFFWEVGGQNIPNDWADILEDRRFGARTVPLHFGPQRAGDISMTALLITMFLHIALLWMSPISFGPPYLLVAVAMTILMLLRPALRLVESHDPRHAMELFNTASYYPLATLLMVLARLIVG